MYGHLRPSASVRLIVRGSRLVQCPFQERGREELREWWSPDAHDWPSLVFRSDESKNQDPTASTRPVPLFDREVFVPPLLPNGSGSGDDGQLDFDVDGKVRDLYCSPCGVRF